MYSYQCHIANIYVDVSEVLDVEKMKNAAVFSQEARNNPTAVQTVVGNIVHPRQLERMLLVHMYIL